MEVTHYDLNPTLPENLIQPYEGHVKKTVFQ